MADKQLVDEQPFKDSGLIFDTDTALTPNSDLRVPSQKAVKAYVDNNAGGGGSFLISETARVDPSGSDSTGTVGDVSKPFLTVQAAINAIQAGSFDRPTVCMTGNADLFEDLTTSLPLLIFRRNAELGQCFNSITLTYPTYVSLQFQSCYNYGPISAAATGFLGVELHDSFCGNVSNSAGPIAVTSATGAGTVQGTISCPGFDITLIDLPNVQNDLNISSAGSNITAKNCRIHNVTAGDVLTLIDSRVTGSNGADSTVYADVMMNGVPPGGATGQILAKASNDDFDTEWVTP